MLFRYLVFLAFSGIHVPLLFVNIRTPQTRECVRRRDAYAPFVLSFVLTLGLIVSVVIVAVQSVANSSVYVSSAYVFAALLRICSEVVASLSTDG